MIRVIGFPAGEPIHSNPFTRLLYESMQAEVRGFSYRYWPDGWAQILHVHWPERELNDKKNPAVAMARLRLKLFFFDRWRAQGARLIWTIHNLHSHAQMHPHIEKWFWPRLIERLDAVTALNRSSLELARETHPALRKVPAFVVPHGHYRGQYPVDESRDAYHELGIDPAAEVILFFGRVERYKNLPALIRCFMQMEPGKNRILLIAGRPTEEGTERQLRELAAGNPAIRLHLQYIANEDAHLYFRVAHLVALPYNEILNSGSLLLALSMNRPALVPALGAMSELAAHFGSSWVRTFRGELTAPTLAEALDWAVGAPRCAQAPLDGLDWESIAAQMLTVYQQVIEQVPRRERR